MALTSEQKIFCFSLSGVCCVSILLITFVVMLVVDTHGLKETQAIVTNNTMVHKICRYCPPGILPPNNTKPHMIENITLIEVEPSILYEVAAAKLGNRYGMCQYNDCYHVELYYDYPVEQKIYHGYHKTDDSDLNSTKSFHDKYPTGSKFTLYYLTRDPNKNFLEKSQSYGGYVVGIASLLIVCMFCAAPILSEIKHNCHQRRKINLLDSSEIMEV